MMGAIIRFDLGRYLHATSTWIYFGILGKRDPSLIKSNDIARPILLVVRYM